MDTPALARGRPEGKAELDGQGADLLYHRVSFLHGTVGEQRDETNYDPREADDNFEKGRLRFPEERLYGRDEALGLLRSIYRRVTPRHVTPKDGRDAAAGGDVVKGGVKKQIVFLAGLSGTGKSALVDELMRRIAEEESDALNRCPLYGCGKFVQYGEQSAPFSPVADVLGCWTADLLHSGRRSEEEVTLVRSSLARAGVGAGDVGGEVLMGVFPVLAPLLSSGGEVEGKKEGANRSQRTERRTARGFNMGALKVVLQRFAAALCRRQDRPAIMFLDDLQWADEASLDVITALLTSESLEHFLFIGAYRSNEVENEGHPFRMRLADIKEGVGGEALRQIDVTNLSPKDVAQFIADSTDKELEDVSAITDLVYKKTLGNIFFVKQALEELVRRNVLYFDIITYEWQWNLDMETELESFVSVEVVDMIMSKLERLEGVHQRALTLAAFTRNTVDVKTLQSLLDADGFSLSVDQVSTLMEWSVEEGLLLKSECLCEYIFAHDLIQEAAYSGVPPGEDRDRLLVQIATVLAERYSSIGEDWALFVAVNHFNSVPRRYLNSLVFLAELNLQAAKLALFKAALPQAVELLRAGAACLPSDEQERWQNYELCLDLFDQLSQLEASLGNYDKAEIAVEEVLRNAACKRDKTVARLASMKISAEKDGRDYSRGAKKGAEILKLPHHPSKTYKLRENWKSRIKCQNGRLMTLLKMPVMEDASKMHLYVATQRNANLSQNFSLAAVIELRALRDAYSKGISPEFAHILVSSAVRLVNKGKIQTAFSYANLATEILKQFPDAQKGSEHAEIRCKQINAVLQLRQPYHEDIAVLHELHKRLISGGKIEMGMGSAMVAIFSHYAAGLPINSVLGSKLSLYEQASHELNQQTFILVFQVCRQFLLNLMGKSKTNPTVFKGEAFNEDEALAPLEGNARKLALRDISTFRLQLAYIFGDESTMEEMVERLAPYPVFDFMVARQHLRISFLGLALFTLGGRGKKEYLKLGGKIKAYMKKLDRAGSPNARPVYLCLEAAKCPSRAAYDKAIDACSHARMLHLEAMMNERCALLLDEEGCEDEIVNYYLTNALFHYNAWGAHSKVTQLRAKYSSLSEKPLQKAPTTEYSISSSQY